MNIVSDTFNIECLKFSNIKPNMIMNGFFTKINYKLDSISLNGIYLAFELKDTNDPYFDKIVNFAPHQNVDIIAKLSSIESCIISEYKKIYQSSNCPIYALSTQMQNGGIKIHMQHFTKPLRNTMSNYIRPKMHKSCSLPIIDRKATYKYVINISGVWENDNNIGITYKIMKGYSQFAQKSELSMHSSL